MSMPLCQNESSIELMKGNYKPKNKLYDVYSSCIHWNHRIIMLLQSPLLINASKTACKLWLISEYTNHSIHSAQMQLKSTMSTW